VNGLIAEALALMKAGDPTSPAAQELARRWSALAEQFKTDDPASTARSKAIWNDAMKDPVTAGKLALNREILVLS
jgi:hypothetical protein